MSEENRKINSDPSSKTGEKPFPTKIGYVIGIIILILAVSYIFMYW
ncbi:hypothetical protein [Yersinia kristensenii]|nr:hypothetical protein [Yersinia kristensenii]EEP89689.1 hypothetical protein ykris0001_38100 [Yersinia kristensenii ATCC 33638]SUP69745.1 Uncharacterised protein [Yersinia kristensenii]